MPPASHCLLTAILNRAPGLPRRRPRAAAPCRTVHPARLRGRTAWRSPRCMASAARWQVGPRCLAGMAWCVEWLLGRAFKYCGCLGILKPSITTAAAACRNMCCILWRRARSVANRQRQQARCARSAAGVAAPESWNSLQQQLLPPRCLLWRIICNLTPPSLPSCASAAVSGSGTPKALWKAHDSLVTTLHRSSFGLSLFSGAADGKVHL